MLLFSLLHSLPLFLFFFFFNDTATTEIYTLSLHDALPISASAGHDTVLSPWPTLYFDNRQGAGPTEPPRSEEHTSELQSPCNLVCRLLLEKKKKKSDTPPILTTIPHTHTQTNRTCRQMIVI